MEVDPERALALSYAPADRRAGLAALFALDDRLCAIVRTARDSTIGMMRLTWWAGALEKLDSAPLPAEPVLTRLAAEVLGFGVSGVELAGMVDGWERLLVEADPDLMAYAAERGRALFEAGARVLGAQDARVGLTGESWALAELARDRLEARALALERLVGAYDRPWPRALRSLGALGLIARSDLVGSGRAGSPGRVGRLLLHRLTGR